ncbi:SDR family oxidoreductase, partial [Cellulomonas massiliensis]|uniref:SDR family oxidoreductase n=1 Tax=Cellulomonas massiliensis TaxID=1465811 RepID=UPI00037090DE
MSGIVVVGGTGQAGRALVQAAVAQGHDVRVVSRHPAAGQEGVRSLRADVLAPDDGPLRAAFEGADVVVDTLNHQGRDAARVLTTAAQAVARTALAAGVGHVVVLSIAHVDRAPGFAYYRAKVAQEDVYGAAAVPSTVVRATQFHPFLEDLLFGAPTRRGAWSRLGLVPYPRGGRLQPIDLTDVARALLEAAAGPSAAFSAGAAVEER